MERMWPFLASADGFMAKLGGLQASSKDNSATKHSMFVYNLASQVSIGNTGFSTTEAALILLLHAAITAVVMLSV